MVGLTDDMAEKSMVDKRDKLMVEKWYGWQTVLITNCEVAEWYGWQILGLTITLEPKMYIF